MVDVIPGTNNRAIREVIDGLDRFTPIISFGGASLEKQEQIEALLGQSVSLLTLIGLNYFLATGADALWYDPSDFSTLFQDANGTIPVTSTEQPVGLMLGKDKGLVRGVERMPVLNFQSGWLAQGKASALSANSFSTIGTGGMLKTNAFESGKVYDVAVEFSRLSTAQLSVRYEGGGADVVKSTELAGTLRLKGVAGTHQIYIRVDGTDTVTITSISIREIPGHHAYQPTSPARPILKQDEYEMYYLKPDGVDDSYLLSKPIDLDSGLIGWAGSASSGSGAILRSGASSGYLSGSTSGWSRDNGGTIPVGLAGKVRQSVLAITNGTTSTQFKDSASGTASVTALSTGLGAIDTLLKSPIDSRFYGLIARAGPSTEAEQALVLRYLDSLLGEVSP